MKKKLRYIFFALIFLPCLFLMSACNNTAEFKINFVVDDAIYATIKTSGDETIFIPDEPTKEGYIFDGWYCDKDVWNEPFTENSLLNIPLKKDMNVYAKFTEKVIVNFNYYYYDEKIPDWFDLSGLFVNAPTSITLEKDSKIILPKVKENYKQYILGWENEDGIVNDTDTISQNCNLSVVFNNEKYGIIWQTGGSMEPVLQVGKYYFYEKCNYEDLELGDIVVMNKSSVYLVHRVVGKKLEQRL